MKAEDVVIGETYLWCVEGFPDDVVRIQGVRYDVGGFDGATTPDLVRVAAFAENLRNTATDDEIDAAWDAKRGTPEEPSWQQEHERRCGKCGQGKAPASYGGFVWCCYCLTESADQKRDRYPAFEGVSAAEPFPHEPRCGCGDCDPVYDKPIDAPNYCGWSEGDVLEYLSKFGEVTKSAEDVGLWRVVRGLFWATVEWSSIRHHWEVSLWWRDGSDIGTAMHQDPTEAMRLTIERWREIVAESDPSPVERPYHCAPGAASGSAGAVGKTRHVFTGDLGQRTDFGAGWHDPTEGK